MIYFVSLMLLTYSQVVLFKDQENNQPRTPQLGPRNTSKNDEKNQDFDLEDSDSETEKEGFQKLSSESDQFSDKSKNYIIFPITLIENMKISKNEDHCFGQFKLRYGNNFTLQADLVKHGPHNLDQFKKQIGQIYNRAKDVQKSIHTYWIGDYARMFKIPHYKDPGDSIKIKIGNYLKGMNTLIESLNYGGEFTMKQNIDLVPGKNSTYKASICSSYPTHLFVPT